MGRGEKRLLGLCAGLGLLAALAAPRAIADVPPGSFAEINSILTGTTISVKETKGLQVLDRVTVRGRIPIPGPGEPVTVTIRREGRLELRRRVRTDPVSGDYKLSLELRGCCEYSAQAAHGTDVSPLFGFEVHPPESLNGGEQTLLFNRLLRDNGYHLGSVTDSVDESTELGILALRKVIGMPWTDSYDPALFEELLRGRARFVPRHAEDGRHVEVDLGRQVMALVEDGRATDVFHISSGAGGTPTGEFSFYQRGPGYNAKGMYYSVYYDGNYATHGYSTVPTYPASHGCIRNPMPYSVFIYNWIELGDTIHLYY